MHNAPRAKLYSKRAYTCGALIKLLLQACRHTEWTSECDDANHVNVCECHGMRPMNIDMAVVLFTVHDTTPAEHPNSHCWTLL